MSQTSKIRLECSYCEGTKFRGQKKSKFNDDDYLTCTACGLENRYGDMLLAMQKRALDEGY